MCTTLQRFLWAILTGIDEPPIYILIQLSYEFYKRLTDNSSGLTFEVQQWIEGKLFFVLFCFVFFNHFVREAAPLNLYGNPYNWVKELFS